VNYRKKSGKNGYKEYVYITLLNPLCASASNNYATVDRNKTRDLNYTRGLIWRCFVFSSYSEKWTKNQNCCYCNQLTSFSVCQLA